MEASELVVSLSWGYLLGFPLSFQEGFSLKAFEKVKAIRDVGVSALLKKMVRRYELKGKWKLFPLPMMWGVTCGVVIGTVLMDILGDLGKGLSKEPRRLADGTEVVRILESRYG